MSKVFKPGDRVVPSGVGRTAAWPKVPGTVLRRMSLGWRVEVRWDGTSFDDEMQDEELEPEGKE